MSAPSRNADRLVAIDGMRGFAALMVVASHASALGIHLVPGLSFEGIGKTGVYLFFVISAYLLTAQWLRMDADRRHEPGTLLRYLMRRFARIYPLYALVLLVGWALPPPGLGVPMDTQTLWRHLSLQEGQGIYWSIPVEFLYYLAIPPLAWWMVLAKAAWLRVAGVLLLLGGLMWWYPAHQAPLNSTHLAYYMPTLLCGSLSAWLMHVWRPDALVVRRRAGLLDVLAWAMLLLSVPAMFGLVGWGEGLTTLHRSFLGWGIFWSAVLIGVQANYLPLTARLMRWRGLGACGRWCFGIYLLHMPALYVARRLPLPAEIKGWLGLALALALAALAYRVIERPAMRFAAGFGTVRASAPPLERV